MGDRELDAIENRYRRGLGGVLDGHKIPARLRDLGALLTEVHELRNQVDRLVEQIEEQETP